MVAFTSLAGLATEQNGQFFGQPQYGSSMIFELYALQENSTSSYPDTDDLLVRFLYQNGTGTEVELVAFPLFGQDPSQVAIAFNDFISGLEEFMIVGVEDWCETCSSYSVFCPAYETDSGSDVSTPSGSSSSSSSSCSSSIKPAVAGVIGAIIALALAAIIAGFGMLLGGFRVYRQKTKRRSELSGFKGGEKLASDQDLSVAKSAVGATVVPADTDAPRGHERIGSWEMSPAKAKEAQVQSLAGAGRPSFEEDDLRVTPFADPVKADERV